jgi:hypothetical protein
VVVEHCWESVDLSMRRNVMEDGRSFHFVFWATGRNDRMLFPLDPQSWHLPHRAEFILS